MESVVLINVGCPEQRVRLREGVPRKCHLRPINSIYRDNLTETGGVGASYRNNRFKKINM